MELDGRGNGSRVGIRLGNVRRDLVCEAVRDDSEDSLESCKLCEEQNVIFGVKALVTLSISI